MAFAHEPVRIWFERAFVGGPTPAQAAAWPAISSGASTLLLAPTGSGKTLAAFLVALDQLMFRTPTTEEKKQTQILYISPLKSLGIDVERNLRSPLVGIQHTAEQLGHRVYVPEVGVRTGDTSPSERRRMSRHPPDILITTPESLYLMLTSSVRTTLATVHTVIIDEIHALVASKRGSHLFLSLERLEHQREFTDQPVLQRVGLSATQRPLDEVARLLGGGTIVADKWEQRPVKIINANQHKPLDIQIEMPSGEEYLWSESQKSIWPSIHPRLVELIRTHQSTLIFVNSRRLSERLASAINEQATEDICVAHHGSLSKDARREVEERLKRGQLPALVATSSLELGIDMGAIDLVIQIEAPPSIASGLQRVGRAGHQVGGISKGIIFPKYRSDLLACAAVSSSMLEGLVEATHYPRNPLDVLAQQIVAIVSMDDISEANLFALVRGAAPFAELPVTLFQGVLDMLSGRYPSEAFAELRPRITWDRIEGRLSARRGAQRIAVTNGGTIPDRGLYGVFLAHTEGPSRRVGELDEEMVFESRVGDIFLLGASSWRIEDITHDRVLVSPAPGEPGKMPFWHGDRPGRPAELGEAIGALTQHLSRMPTKDAETHLIDTHKLCPDVAARLIAYLHEQIEAGELPTNKCVILERFTDEVGDWRVVILSPYGARVHAPWATVVAARLRAATAVSVDSMWTDDGMAFRLLEAKAPPDAALFFPPGDDVLRLITQHLGNTSLFAAHFRENAGRALLLPKKNPNRRSPLWAMRRKAANLLEVATQYPDFPIILETYRECLQDIFDLPALEQLLRDIADQRIRTVVVDNSSPSPFSASVLFSYAANFIYDGDTPLAERRAQALSIDQTQLRALLGDEDFRQLLDIEIIENIEYSLQRLDNQYPIRHADALHDLLLHLGDLSLAEIQLRSVPDADIHRWIHDLQNKHRIMEVQIANTQRFAAVEDAGRLRDGLGTIIPSDIPPVFLESPVRPLQELVTRYARTHGPFTAYLCAKRLGGNLHTITQALQQLEKEGRVHSGSFLPSGEETEWCDAEVLRRIKRKSLARLRAEIMPVEQAALGRFLPEWHHLHHPQTGLDGVLNAIEILQGAALAISDFDAAIMPVRVDNYHPADVDELCAAGELMWRGLEPVGSKDGRIAIYLTSDYAQLSPPTTLAEGKLPLQLRHILKEHGAQFFSGLCNYIRAYPTDISDALWAMVWAGEVTNDTLRPLRSRFSAKRRSSPNTPFNRNRGGRGHHRFRSRQTNPPGTEGRWSLLPCPTPPPNETVRQTAQTHQLLKRHGLLTREAAGLEVHHGGFSSIYPILKAMEESGKIRRGYFVEGLGATQFAWPGAEDQLRQLRSFDPSAEQTLYILAATDPANPYGAALPWPARPDGVRPQRIAGARIILRGGWLIAYLGRTEDTLLTYNLHTDTSHDSALVKALGARVKSGHRVFQLLRTIDGVPSQEHALSPLLKDEGFRTTSQGMLLRIQ